MTTATLAPALPVHPDKLYFVLADFGSLGSAYTEVAPESGDWQSVIAALARGEWRDPRAVFEADRVAGTWRDVTEKAFLAARLHKEGVPESALA